MPIIIVSTTLKDEQGKPKILEVNHWIQDGGTHPFTNQDVPAKQDQEAIDFWYSEIGSKQTPPITKADTVAFIKPQDPYSHGHKVLVVGDPPTDVSVIRNPEPAPPPDHRKEFEAACKDCDAALAALPDVVAGKSIIANLQKEIKIIARRLNLMNEV